MLSTSNSAAACWPASDLLILLSVLHPGQAVEAPAVVLATLLQFVDLAFETFEHVEHISEAALGSRLCGQHRTLAAAAQQQDHGFLVARLRFELAHETRVAREAGARGPRH